LAWGRAGGTKSVSTPSPVHGESARHIGAVVARKCHSSRLENHRNAPICGSKAEALDRTADSDGFDCPQHDKFKVAWTAFVDAGSGKNATPQQWESALTRLARRLQERQGQCRYQCQRHNDHDEKCDLAALGPLPAFNYTMCSA
jgi:hypothetical protein